MIKLDGGLSTALENNGNKLTTSLWTGELIRTDPVQITKAHLDFINAGAQIIITSPYRDWETDRKSTRLNSSHSRASRMPSSA